MYYDTYRRKSRRKKETRRRIGCIGWLIRAVLKLIIFILVLVILAAGLLYIMPVSMMNLQPAGVDLGLIDGLPGTRVNILLLGLDFLDEGQQRSDSMIIASAGSDGLRLTSVMRDIIVDIPGHGSAKINSAYALGGANLAMRTVNETFDLNITNYAAVDLGSLVDLVDAVGGVEIDISDKELQLINSHAWDTFKKISAQDPEKYAHYADSQPITQTGIHKLDGLFATAYARIRYADSDYVRTARQREVISAILNELRENYYRPEMWLRLYNVLKDSVKTNLSLPEIISIGEKVLISGEITTNRVPMDQYKKDHSAHIEITDSAGNIRSLHEFIYN